MIENNIQTFKAIVISQWALMVFLILLIVWLQRRYYHDLGFQGRIYCQKCRRFRVARFKVVVYRGPKTTSDNDGESKIKTAFVHFMCTDCNREMSDRVGCCNEIEVAETSV